MKIPSAHQIKELDEYTIEAEGISSLDLMERASSKVTEFIKGNYPDRQRHITVFSGPGNNGGDGLAVARQLNTLGYEHVEVFLFNTSNSLSADCKSNAERLVNECDNVPFTEVTQQFEAPQLTSQTLIIDALFGTGLNKPVSGGYAALVQFINALGAEIVSIDMPSGLMCEDNSFNSYSSIVCATHTLTFQLPKLAQLLPDNQNYVGELHLMDIGLSSDKMEEMPVQFCITEPNEVRRLLKSRPAFGHKGTFGHALLIAGQYGMAGAAILSARACIRSGVGKVTLHTPTSNNAILQTSVPEAIISHDADENIFTTPQPIDNYTAVGIGPGIGTNKRTALALIEQISHSPSPLLLDADALNILGGHKGWISQIPANTILTPHPGEMIRLGICNHDSYSILMEAINMAKSHSIYIVLKGHYTAICTPSGHVYFNPTGNSGMATAGSGDVLTGIITSLLAQGYNPEAACRLGVYLHGLAGDVASSALCEESVTASDIISHIPHAFRKLREI